MWELPLSFFTIEWTRVISDIIDPIRVRVENGKKVYDKFAGVNQPMELI